MRGSILVATPDAVHSTFIELRLFMPQHHIRIPPRPLCLGIGLWLRLGLRLGYRPCSSLYGGKASCIDTGWASPTSFPTTGRAAPGMCSARVKFAVGAGVRPPGVICEAITPRPSE